jgi:cell division protein FtsZ
MAEDLMNFDMPVDRSSIIKVIGVGGGGSNAVNHMCKKGIKDVNFVVCNTDAQALTNSPVAVKIQLGESRTEGRGAGNKPEVGREAAIENLDDIKEVLSGNTKMVFITAGMGGGTGTGAAPVIAKAAKEMGLLTVAIVTIPFRFEGQQRIRQAIEGIEEIQKHVDSLLVINNQKLREIFGDLKLADAFARADDVLSRAAKGIAEIITVHGYINVDFADVETVMSNSGVAIMGSATASGENRAVKAIEEALSSPLLNNNDITGAKSILLNITSGAEEISMDEVGEITDYVNMAAHKNALIIWGTGVDESLETSISVTVIATGFGTKSIPELYHQKDIVDKVPLRESSGNISAMSGEFEIKNKEESEFQQTLEFNTEEKSEEYILYDETNMNTDPDEQVKMREKRVKKLKEAHERVKTSAYNSKHENEAIEELENEPAYIRKQIKLDPETPSRESEVSKFRLSEDEEDGGPKLREDNSYLHDNVD